MRIYGILIGETSFGYWGFLYPGADFGLGRVVPEKGRFRTTPFCHATVYTQVLVPVSSLHTIGENIATRA